jgi:hypothetical protein
MLDTMIYGLVVDDPVTVTKLLTSVHRDYHNTDYSYSDRLIDSTEISEVSAF